MKIKRFVKKIKWKIFNLIEEKRGRFITVHERPFFAKDMEITNSLSENYPKTAILVQGPVLEKRDFTLETIRLYKKIFKNEIIILSTWNDAPKDIIEKIEKENIKIVFSEKPKVSGYKNLNYQLISTQKGIEEAQKLNARYIIKTRTDQRFYNPNTIGFLHSLLKIFPSNSNYPPQKEKIIAINQGTSKYKKYHLCDQFQFGYIEDVKKIWNIELLKDNQELESTENYVFKKYLSGIGWNIKNTEKDSLSAYGNLCIIIDRQMIDWYWYKYTRHREFRKLDYKYKVHDLSFSEWIQIYKKSKYE